MPGPALEVLLRHESNRSREAAAANRKALGQRRGDEGAASMVDAGNRIEPLLADLLIDGQP